MKLYEDVAGRIARLVAAGTFRTGERVPSVRKLSRELKVSMSTVLEAYRLLEIDGLIEARPQSGYYVRPRFQQALEMRTSRPTTRRPSPVGVDELVLRVMTDTHDASLVQLGAAIPNPAMLPTEKLNRCLVQAVRQPERLSHLSDLPPGCEPLRVQVARRLLSAGCALSPEEIVTTNGCLEAVSLALRVLCQPGDTIAIESPAYFGLLQAIQLQALRVLEIPSHPRTGISLDALEFALEQHPVKACLVSTNFSNPLGSCIPPEGRVRLARMLSAADVPLIEDDILGELHFGPQRPGVVKAHDKSDNVLLCSSFSKDLAPGYRVGWIAPGRWYKQVLQMKMATNVASATLPQLAVAEFLASGGYERHMRRIRRAYADQMATLTDRVVQSFPAGTRVSHPEGGFVLWVEMPASVDSMKLYERALEKGITFAPGPMFSARQRYRNFLRLNGAFWDARVEQAVATLGRLVTEAAR